ncbi:MAG: DUF116 domain-containing protein [Syntrophales bacterium]|nr:DUF116 domain-containing protein [Syntrophales bacterium]
MHFREIIHLLILRIKFHFLLLCAPFLSLPRRREWEISLVREGNRLFEAAFQTVPLEQRAIFLPHCLIHRDCPAKFSKELGIMCINCKRCRCGEIKALAENLGYQFYITPSTGFTRRLAQRRDIRAAIGTTCLYEIERGLKMEKITLNGVDLKAKKVIPQVHLTDDNDCVNNGTNWEVLITNIFRLSRTDRYFSPQ